MLPTQNPVRSMHSVVLNNGKVLLIAGSGNSEEMFEAGTFTSAVYDPVNGTYKQIPTPDDMFCAGPRPAARRPGAGHERQQGATRWRAAHGYEGYKDSYIFDPVTETYSKTNDMNDGHWYPSATILGNGDVISFGGLREDSTGSVTAELWSDAEQQVAAELWKVNQTWSYWGLYPSMILMQDGRLFYSGSHVFGNGMPGTGSAIYDYDANTITDVPGLQQQGRARPVRERAAAARPGPEGPDHRRRQHRRRNPDANRLTDIIDLKAAEPGVRRRARRSRRARWTWATARSPQTGDQGKMYVSAVLLPDGKVLETGGALHNRADPVFEASIYDPATNTFDPVADRPGGARLPLLRLPAARRPRHDHRRQPGQRHLEPRRVDLHPAVPAQGRAPDRSLR